MCKQESKNNFLNILQSKQKWSESRILQIIGGRNLQLVRCLCLHHHFTVFKYLNRCCDIFFLGLSGFCHFFKFKKMVGIKYRISTPVAVLHTASPLYRWKDAEDQRGRSQLHRTHFVLRDGQLGEGTTVGWRVIRPRWCSGTHRDTGCDGWHLSGVTLCSDSWSLWSRVHVALYGGSHTDKMLDQALPKLHKKQRQLLLCWQS